MDFCLIVKITKKNVSIHYQIANGDVGVLMPEGSEEIPMAFCLRGGELLMNRFAAEQVDYSKEAFSDYFNLIKDPYRNFNFAGENKPIKQLLYYGLESHFSNFLREKVYDNTPIEAHRESFPLRFLFADDISNEERKFVIVLFQEQGYRNVAEIRVTEQLFNVLLPAYNGAILTLSGIGGDLYVNYFTNAHSKALNSKRMSGLGKDQRLSICVELILDYINERYYSPFPPNKIKAVEELLLKETIQQFSTGDGPTWGKIIGPDGETYEYDVKRKDIERKMRSMQGSSTLVAEVKHFLNNIGGNTQDTAVVLMNDVNSNYFKDILKDEFKNVVSVTEYQFKRIWEEVFHHVDFTPPEISISIPPQAPSIPDPSGPSVLPSSSGMKTPKAPDMPPILPSSNRKETPKAPDVPPVLPSPSGKESPKAPDVPPVLPPISGNRTQQVIPKPPVTPAPTKKVNTPSAPPAPPVMPTPTKKVNTPIPTPPPPPVSIQPKTTQPAPPKKPASNTPSAAASAKESVSKVVGGLFDAGKKSLGDMGDKIKTGGLAGGMMSSIKGVVANLSDNIVVVGRKGEQKMAITENTVSREHCTLKLMRNGKVEVEDLSSKNGTFINDIRITKAVVDQEDIIRLGPIFKAKVKDLLVVK